MGDSGLSDGCILAPGIVARGAFRIEHLPLLSRLDRAYLTPRRRLLRHLINKPARALLNLAYRSGLGGTGKFALESGDGVQHLPFNARNLQFNVLYLPQYATGFEPKTVAVLERALGTHGVFFDVGANWGYFTLYLASAGRFEGSVVAFEPVPSTFADLSALVRGAALDGRVSCQPIALSDRNGSASMELPFGMRSGVARLTDEGAVSVRVARLDDLGLAPPDVIKLDVEGHEAQALSGAVGTLERHRPLIVFESWDDRTRCDAVMAPFRVLARLGYRFFHLAWVETRDGIAVPMEFEPRPDGAADLALVPFEPSLRYLLARGSQNFVACHAARVDELAARLAHP